ncbi:MAG: hypothetical protein ACYCPF_04500 [Streptosporangiaceae bacterium]
MMQLLRPTRLHSFAAGAVALAGIAALTQVTFATNAQAGKMSSATRNRHETCSLATLRGVYVSRQDGWQISANSREPFAFTAIYNFNGHGFARGQSTRSLNGVISHVHFVVHYTLNRTCAGTETLRDGTGGVRHYVIYVLPSGRQYTYLRTDPGVVGAGSAVSG